ncbi:MAG: hypothetical protein ABSF03_29725 [Streptosporangiaceae bacterium]
MTEPAPGEADPLVDLSDITLERIARLCGPSASGLDPDDITDRPMLRRAVRKVQRDGERGSGLLAGFSSHLR